MKYKVMYEFIDVNSGNLNEVGSVIDITKDRADEINSTLRNEYGVEVGVQAVVRKTTKTRASTEEVEEEVVE